MAGRVDIRDAQDVVKMDDKPSQVIRSGKATSMWSAIEAVREGARAEQLRDLDLDRAVGGRGWQTNVLFAGVVALGNVSKPDLFGGRADFTAEGALFGIRFEGQPDLRRILCPEGFVDHALRKDYPLHGEGERVDFKVLERVPYFLQDETLVLIGRVSDRLGSAPQSSTEYQ